MSIDKVSTITAADQGLFNRIGTGADVQVSESFFEMIRAHAAFAASDGRELRAQAAIRETPAEQKYSAAWMEAHNAANAKREPLIEETGRILQSFRQLFEDSGMPIVDAVRFRKTAVGGYKIDGWGTGGAVSHPQATFLEAVLNGKAPGFEGLTREANAILDSADQLWSQIEDIDRNLAEQFGETFEPRGGLFEDGMVMATEYTGRNASAGRQLRAQDPKAYEAFRTSLGADAEMLSERQILSRFYFNEKTLPGLDGALREFFDAA